MNFAVGWKPLRASRIQARVGQALALRFAYEEPSPHVEQRIYDGFPNATDQALMVQFHNVDWPDRTAVADRFEDFRVKEFAHRLISFERPDLLPAAKAAEYSGC